MRGERMNLVGRKYGKLKVLEKAGKNSYRGIMWRCRCDCGNEKLASTSNLNAGRVVSCSHCGKSDAIGGRGVHVNLVGRKYGLLTVLEKIEAHDQRGVAMWLCQCECGNITRANTGNLNAGRATVCGICHQTRRIRALKRVRKTIAAYGFSAELVYSSTGNKKVLD